MLISSALFAAIAVSIVGTLVLWSNPRRWTNRLVFSCSVHISLWLACVYLALRTPQGVDWLRRASSISALIPLHFWCVKEAIATVFFDRWKELLRRASPWLFVSGLLAILPFTEYFIPASSTPAKRLYGIGYFLYIAGIMFLYLLLGISTYYRIKSLLGERRLALQVWLGGGCASAVTILVLMTANAITHDSRYIYIQSLVVLVFYAGTSFAITTSRVFDARQLFLLGAEKFLLISSVSITFFALNRWSNVVMPEPLALFTSVALSLWFAVAANGWLDHIFCFYSQAVSVRQALFQAAQRETKTEKLEVYFEKILMGWGQTDHCIVFYGSGRLGRSDGKELSLSSSVVGTMRQLRWATPERLSRERPAPDRGSVFDLLSSMNLGALVLAEGPSFTALVGVGVSAARRPYTYPQMMQLVEMASIMEGALERAYFSARAQHSEQLATVGLLGANLAHEIRNPLVSIKTFVQLLPDHYQDPVFRKKFFRLISDEVHRIDQLTQQLLDLASPRNYVASQLQLHAVLRPSLVLITAKANDKRVELQTSFDAASDLVFTDAAAAKQVLLNLCYNAIQAADTREHGERWIRIATRNVDNGVEMVVSDSGPGIAPEIHPRLFQPFQTTKSTGFGLGLAICRDILANLQATISADPPVPGQGATFRVVYPCHPSSS